MKKRIIFTIYIDIPEENLDETGYSNNSYNNKHRHPRAAETKDKLKAYKGHLMWTQKAYADLCNADYRLFYSDKRWFDYYKNCRKIYDKLPMYHILNYYKHHLMYELVQEGYDEVFYCDMDVIPTTEDNIFVHHDMSYFWSKNNNEMAEWAKHWDLSEYNTCDRNPGTKYWNCYALLLQEGHDPENNVINTGTMIGGADVIRQINWPEEFPIMVEKMKQLQDDKDTMFPKALHDRFAFDNETMFSYLVESKGFKYASLKDEWHGRLPEKNIDPEHKIIHAINKKFELIWPKVKYKGRRFYENI